MDTRGAIERLLTDAEKAANANDQAKADGLCRITDRWLILLGTTRENN